MCHNWGSPVFLANIKYCLQGETSNIVIGPPETVIHRIWDGSGTGSQPVKGTNNGTVYPSHHAIADLTVVPNNEYSPSYAETVLNHDMS